jgi:hypothetical protein
MSSCAIFSAEFWFPACVDWSFYDAHPELFPRLADLYVCVYIALFITIARFVLEMLVFKPLARAVLPGLRPAQVFCL